MTAISPAALPPVQPLISEAQRKHAMFNDYMNYRANMSRLLLQADSFSEWLAQSTDQADRNNAALHPRYQEFLQWMRDNKGGARRCPAGSFPLNFNYWLQGNRW